MNNYDKKVINVTNTDIIKKILFSLVSVARSKTSKDYAWGIIKNLVLELSVDYDFLHYILIDKLDNLKDSMDDISVMLDFDTVESTMVGEVIQKIIDLFKKRMGNKAGYFFLSEFKEVLGDHYYSVIKKMGVDLRLIDLQKEIYGWDKETYKIKDKYNSNIAYLEKRK